MTIQKFNSKSRVTQQLIPYVQLNSKVIDLIDDLEAGFVWVYLSSKSIDWTVIKQQLKSKFKIGNDKLKKIFAYLKRHNLITYHAVRSEDGKTISHHDIEVLNGENFSVDGIKPLTDKSTGRIINRVDSYSIRNGKLPIIDNTNNELNTKRERAKRADAPLSELHMSSANQKLCIDKKLNPTLIREKFIAYAESKGWKRKDWQAALKKWILDERSYSVTAKVSGLASVDSQSTSFKTPNYNDPKYFRQH